MAAFNVRCPEDPAPQVRTNWAGSVLAALSPSRWPSSCAPQVTTWRCWLWDTTDPPNATIQYWYPPVSLRGTARRRAGSSTALWPTGICAATTPALPSVLRRACADAPGGAESVMNTARSPPHPGDADSPFRGAAALPAEFVSRQDHAVPEPEATQVLISEMGDVDRGRYGDRDHPWQSPPIFSQPGVTELAERLSLHLKRAQRTSPN